MRREPLPIYKGPAVARALEIARKRVPKARSAEFRALYNEERKWADPVNCCVRVLDYMGLDDVVVEIRRGLP
jgi:hypothetical protein